MSISTTAQSPVVVELFTSQGCSSCPSADKNLTEILKTAETNGWPVYGLSFHVDYWNYIGWKDPYSQKAFTERQRNYAAQLGTEQVYTPQMIINGQKEFVGSNKSETNSSVSECLNQKLRYRITLSHLVASSDKLKFSYGLDANPHGEILQVALVEKYIENLVERGENSGKRLHHDNVVRVFKSFPLSRQGEVEIEIPELNSKNLSLIIFAQNSQGQIVAADKQTIH